MIDFDYNIAHFKTKIVFSFVIVMLGFNDNTITTHTQLEDKSTIDEVEASKIKDKSSIDELIESKIKVCQRENGRLMTRTSQRLREQYGNEMVTKVVNRLSRRRQRKNQNLKNIELINLISSLIPQKS